MTRAIARTAVTAFLLLACGGTHALSLGPATVASDLSSPLRAEIPITELIGSGIDPDALVVDVPGFNEHARLGVVDPVIPAALEVSVVRDASGGARLRLSTQRAVREPMLRFLLRASWPGGATTREYTLLLDPPAAARPMAASTPQATARPRPASATASQRATLGGNPFQQPAPARAGTRYGPVALGDTLHAILASAYPDSPRDVMAREVLARNPRAFAGGDPNRLLLGATLELPAAATHASIAAASATGPAPSVAVAGVDHLVRPGETLYAIARAIPGTSEAQLASIVQRLLARNPHAFIDGDMNRLRAGARLQLEGTSPTADSPANAPANAPAITAAASTASTPGNTSAALPVQTPIQAPAQTPVQASVQVPAQLVDELRRDLGVVQRDIAAQVEHQGSLRERMALLEQEIGNLRDRDAALSVASDALEERLSATATVAVRQPAAQPRPGSSIFSPATARPVLAPTPAPVPAPMPSVGTAPPAPVPALTTPPGSAPPAPAPMPSVGTAPPAPVPALTTPPGSAPPAPAGAIPRALSEPIWLAGGAGVLLLLLLLLVLRRRRAHAQSIVTAQASPPRHGDEQAARRRLAEVRDAHASHSSSNTEHAQPAAAAAAASDNVRHTDGAKASALAKEAAVHLAYGDHAAAHDSIAKAIRLAPHQDEYKMMLMTVYQSKGQHDKARAIVDELLNRRDQLSGDVRAQVDQQVQRFGR